jgi:Ca-activated chloride channel family protein
VRFANPEAFLLYWLVAGFFLFGIWRLRASNRKISRAFGERITPLLVSSVAHSNRKWKLVIQTLALCFFVLAAARPQMGESMQEVKAEGVEIMIMVDVSESMLAEDVKPNRLEQAKLELSRLLDLMPGNKVGIIAFAGSATLLSPLSTDPGALKLYLESLSPNMVSSQGTDFEKAFEEAKAAFERGGVVADDTTKVTRVLIVASDGEDHNEGDLQIAKDLAAAGTRIFTMAYGTEKGGPIPVRDRLGYLSGYKKDRQGQTILTLVKGDTLRELAKAGQGSFYHASIGGTHLKNVVEDINNLEKAEFESQVATQYEERFQIVLLVGLLLALFEFFISERKPGFRLWKGRFEVPAE